MFRTPLGAALLILPWVVRNYRELGQFIPFSTGGGSLLLQANNRIVVADSNYHGYAIWDTSLPEYAVALRQPNDEFRRDAVAKQLAGAFISHRLLSAAPVRGACNFEPTCCNKLAKTAPNTDTARA